VSQKVKDCILGCLIFLGNVGHPKAEVGSVIFHAILHSAESSGSQQINRAQETESQEWQKDCQMLICMTEKYV